MEQSHKIPVFYHIPKCGGTYILSLYLHLNRENQKKKRKPSENRRKINVYLNEKRYIEITGVLESHSNTFSIKELYKLIDNKKIKITSIFIQPTGDGDMGDSRKQVDELLSYINKKPVYFTVIRDVFQRLYSEYAYLSSTMSQHEPSFNKYAEYESFEEFLIKCNTYNNSICKQIMPDVTLDDKSFEQLKSFFDDFTIATMQNIKLTAIKVWKQCYGWTAEYKNKKLLTNKNKNKQKINIQDISDQAREQFLSKTEWDRKLYAYLSQT